MKFNKLTGAALSVAGFLLLTWWFYRVAVQPKPRPTPIGVAASTPANAIPTPWLLPAGIAALAGGRHLSEQ